MAIGDEQWQGLVARGREVHERLAAEERDRRQSSASECPVAAS